MTKYKEALFLAGPSIPARRYEEIVAEAAVYGQEARSRGLIVVSGFPQWDPIAWPGFVPTAHTGNGEARRFKTLEEHFKFQLGRAEEVYAFAVARTHSQRNWVNTLFRCAHGLDVKVCLRVY